jgi:hypothetical protein
MKKSPNNNHSNFGGKKSPLNPNKGVGGGQGFGEVLYNLDEVGQSELTYPN